MVRGEQNRTGQKVIAPGCIYRVRLGFSWPHLVSFHGGGEEVGGCQDPETLAWKNLITSRCFAPCWICL